MAVKAVSIILGSDCVTGLQCARILDRRGIPVIGISANPDNAFCQTQSLTQVYPAEASPDQLISAFRDIRQDHGEAVIFPCTDEMVMALSLARNRVPENFHFALPSHRQLVTLADKSEFYHFAKKHSLRIPRTRLIRSVEDIIDVKDVFKYPAILKPKQRSQVWFKIFYDKVVICNDSRELEQNLRRALKQSLEIVVQEVIAGGDACMYSYCSYMNSRSEPLSEIGVQKIRQWPPDIGTGCLAVHRHDPEVREQVIEMLKLAEFHGLSSVQLKFNQQDKQSYFIEANVGRVTLNMPLAEICGVEMLYTMYSDLVGKPIPDQTVKYPGAKWIYWKRDIGSAWVHFKTGKLTVREWLASVRGRKQDALFRWRDPKPFILDVTRWFFKLFNHNL